jgi:uncharacterized membrane protein
VRISFRFPGSPASLATRAYRRRALMLLIVGIVALPLAWFGPSCGHDFDFHLQSWLEVVRHWRQGIVYPHWDASANYGAGEPRFVFYPPLSWVMGGLLGLVLPWAWVPLAWCMAVLLALVFSCYHAAREWMPEDNAALAACLYVLSPYTLFVLYERSAFGELLAGAILPLVFLFGLRRKPSVLPLAGAVAALWLTNEPAAVMGCYALAVLVIAAAIGQRRWDLPLRNLAGVALGLGLAGFYLVPAIHEQRWVEIGRAIAPGMSIRDSFLFAHTASPYHDQVLRTASWIAAGLLAALVALFYLWFRDRKPAALRWPLAVLTALLALLLLPFSLPVWNEVPELRFLQFPWRWLLVLSLIAAWAAGFAIRKEALTRRAISLRAAGMILFAAVMVALAVGSYRQACDAEDAVPGQLAGFHTFGFEGTDEYVPAPADNGDLQQGTPLIRVVKDPQDEVGDSSIAENPFWQPDPQAQVPAQVRIERQGVERLDAVVRVEQPAYALVRLMRYPAWRVTLNGRRVTGLPVRDDGLMAIPLPPGTDRIRIGYEMTPDMRVGDAVSLASLAVVLAVLLGQPAVRKRTPHRV